MIFWGAVGQAKVLRECMKQAKFNLIALFDNNKSLISPFNDVPLYFGNKGFQRWKESRFSNEAVGFLVAIGGQKGKDRLAIHEYLKSHGLIPLVAKHPTAFIADSVEIGEGSQLLANSSVAVESKIGRECIINTAAIVDHESQIDDGVHICPGAHLPGCVRIGACSTIGTGAVILPRIVIGEGVVVGAGSVVIENVAPYSVIVGNPGRVIREIT